MAVAVTGVTGRKRRRPGVVIALVPVAVPARVVGVGGNDRCRRG
jgi:hypothetical protein